MNCPRCDRPGVCQDAPETGTYGTWRRRYECVNGHRFVTVETHQPTNPTAKHWLQRTLQLIATPNRSKA
jgi:transcriptional regulator NrdR family protein